MPNLIDIDIENMSLEENRVYQKIAESQRCKADAGKARLTLVPRKIITAIARVRDFGCEKYKDPDNWKLVKPERYLAARMMTPFRMRMIVKKHNRFFSLSTVYYTSFSPSLSSEYIAATHGEGAKKRQRKAQHSLCEREKNLKNLCLFTKFVL